MGSTKKQSNKIKRHNRENDEMEIARRGVAKMLIPKYKIFFIKESVLENAKIMYECVSEVSSPFLDS